jgi:hypothetical protein
MATKRAIFLHVLDVSRRSKVCILFKPRIELKEGVLLHAQDVVYAFMATLEEFLKVFTSRLG